MCSLAWTMMRKYMPSTVASRSSMWTLRWRSFGVTAKWACLTASSERLSQLITSAFEVTDFSMPSLRSAGVFGAGCCIKLKFAVAMCQEDSLEELSSDCGRHEIFSAVAGSDQDRNERG